MFDAILLTYHNVVALNFQSNSSVFAILNMDLEDRSND